MPRDAALAWTAGQFAKTHNVYLGTDFADVNNASAANALGILVSTGQTAATYEPADVLPYGQTYYWRVDEVNAPPTGHDRVQGRRLVVHRRAVRLSDPNVTATASTSQAGMGGPEKTVDGSGLNADDQHSVERKGDVAQPRHDAELDSVRVRQGLQSCTNCGSGTTTRRSRASSASAPRDVKIEYSLDGSAWTELAGVPEFARGDRDGHLHP